jgi:hypothetical protein
MYSTDKLSTFSVFWLWNWISHIRIRYFGLRFPWQWTLRSQSSEMWHHVVYQACYSMMRGPLGMYHCFGGNCCLPLHSRRLTEYTTSLFPGDRNLTAAHSIDNCCVNSFRPYVRLISMFRKSLINCRTVAYARLHYVTSQKIPLFIGSAMRAQNIAWNKLNWKQVC